jgi:hypothetical protein
MRGAVLIVLVLAGCSSSTVVRSTDTETRIEIMPHYVSPPEIHTVISVADDSTVVEFADATPTGTVTGKVYRHRSRVDSVRVDVQPAPILVTDTTKTVSTSDTKTITTELSWWQRVKNDVAGKILLLGVLLVMLLIALGYFRTISGGSLVSWVRGVLRL